MLRMTTHDSDRVDLSVVVPAYNEEQRLPNMLDETIAFLKARQQDKSFPPAKHIYKAKQFTYEIIIVDDGSLDGTTACGLRYRRRFGDSIRVITLEKNRGKGGAVREGVLAARGDYILFADADGASKFSDIEKLEDFMNRNQDTSDLVIAIGSRAHMEKEAIASRSLFRTLLMKGFHLLVWTCCVRQVRDTQCGFKMFNRKAARYLFSAYHNESWAFDVELLFLAEKVGCTVGEIAINWTEIEGSKIVPVFSWIRMGWDVLCLAFLYTTGIYDVPQIEDGSRK